MDIKFLIIGGISKKYLIQLKRLADNLKISERILFLGSIPHDSIKDYYSIIDIIVLPRLDIRLNRLVTPLKPLEAMAFKKLVIASDLPGLRYSIIPKKTGDLFKPEDPLDLASKIIFYLINKDKRKEIEDYSRIYVQNEFSWKKTVYKYMDIYIRLLKNKN